MLTRRIEVPPGDLACRVDARCGGAERTRWVEAGDGTPAIANEAVISCPDSVGAEGLPGDLACGVDAKWEGLKSTRYPVKGGEGAPAIAHEAKQTPRRLVVAAGDLARGVDAHAVGADAGRKGLVKGGEAAAAIADE